MYQDPSNSSPFHSLQETYEQKRAEHLKELKTIENEMRSSYLQKVSRKDAEVKKKLNEVICWSRNAEHFRLWGGLN